MTLCKTHSLVIVSSFAHQQININGNYNMVAEISTHSFEFVNFSELEKTSKGPHFQIDQPYSNTSHSNLN